ncbi:IctB family putative bicarbonate transporter [Calothrix rhizosoleniae]|uniref:IctB family putative bicarbonate transporter n=1 Tax=Calothrix rhizosoleniae TaxID=888997 RepID=UPI000B498E64|nr:IctB family putative bicarbonate transporter [Calothrix rhizosoleniae]
MNLIWQRFTLSTLPLKAYLSSSFLHHITVGLLGSWRKGSILMQWGDTIGAILLCLVYLLAPFVPTSLVGVLLAACFLFWLLLTVSDDTWKQSISTVTPIHLVVVIYWLVAAAATALSPVKAYALRDLITFSLYLPIFFISGRVLRSPRLRSLVITVFLHTSLVVSVYGLRQWFFGAPQLATWVDPTSSLSKTTRVYSYLGNPNLLAGYLIAAVIFSCVAIFAWQTWLQKALAVTMVVVNGSCLILTFSRGGWIGLVAAILALMGLLYYWWSIRMPRFWQVWTPLILLGIILSIFALGIVFVEPFKERVLSIFADRKDSSNNFRRNVWTAVFQMIDARPWIGIGPGHNAFNKVYPLYQVPGYSALSAYSIFLEVIVETGFLGLASFLWLLTVSFNTAALQLQRLRLMQRVEAFWLMGAIAAMVGMLAHGLVDTVWYRPSVNTLWWLMVGLIASYWTPLGQNQSQELDSSNSVATL